MTDERVFSPDRKKIKSTAKAQLSNNGVIFKLIAAIAICWVAYITVELFELAIQSVFILAFPTLEDSVLFLYLTSYLMEAVAFFVLAPTVMGIFRLASKLSTDSGARLSEMLFYFRAKNYPRACGAFALIYLPVWAFSTAIAESLAALDVLFASATQSSLYALSYLGVAIGGAGLACLLLLPYGRLFSVAAAVVNGEGQPLRACIRAALGATKRRSAAIFRFRLGFVPIVLLSFATVGIMLIIFTVPYMLISYFYYNAHLFGVDHEIAAKTEVTFDER